MVVSDITHLVEVVDGGLNFTEFLFEFVDEVLVLVLAFLELGYDFVYGFFEEVEFVLDLGEGELRRGIVGMQEKTEVLRGLVGGIEGEGMVRLSDEFFPH